MVKREQKIIVNIHGKAYDLTNFADRHPGGKYILSIANGAKDSSAMFESYHAMKDMESIELIMKKYEIGPSQSQSEDYIFDDYRYLAQKAKIQLKHYKFNNLWLAKVLIIFSIYFVTFFAHQFYDFSLLATILLGLVAGSTFESLGFMVMHDASHYGITYNPNINVILGKIWSAQTFFNFFIWGRHHIYAHHSFTGDIHLDPDQKHIRPFIKKYESDTQVIEFTSKNYNFFNPFVLFIFPGQFFGQGISYVISLFKGRLWGVKLSYKEFIQSITWYEILLYLISTYNVIKGGIVFTVCYYFAINFLYHVCIAPDHDTYDSAITNHTDTKNWMQRQILNSGNFSNDSFWVTQLMGGINFQIEHHLFPTVNHVHYPKLKPIVKEYCEKKNIAYNEHPDLISAYKSYMQTIGFINRVQKEKEQ